MRIVYITEYYPDADGSRITGGVETRAYQLSHRLAAQHHVTVVTSWQGNQIREEALGNLRILRVGPLHPYANEGHVLSRLRFAMAAYRSLKALGTQDVVDAQCFVPYLPTYLAGRKTHASTVATFQEVWLSSWIKNKGLFTGSLGYVWERLALRCPWDMIIAASHDTSDKLMRCGVARDRIMTIPNGYDHSEFRNLTPSSRDPFRLTTVNRLVHTKRIDTLLHALALIKDMDRLLFGDLHLEIIGEGPHKTQLQREAHFLGVHDKVNFRGRIPERKTLLERLASSGLFIHPSGVEGFGLVLLEASACGLPVIASSIPPFREILSQIQGGRIFPLGDAKALAREIISHYRDKPIAVGDPRSYDWDNIAPRVIQAYERMRSP